MTVFLDVASCNLVEIDHVSKVITASKTALMMEAESTSEMSVNFYQTARCNIPEDRHLHTTNVSP
jgi:hypothetical protein